MEKGRRINTEKSTRKEKRVKNKKAKKVINIVIGIVAFIIICLIANNYIVFDKNKTINLVINNKNVTSNLKNQVLIENNTIYLSQSDIENFFDKHIYKEDETNKIITTYGKKIAAIGFEKNSININGSDKEIYAHAIEKDGQVYLPISEMKDVYDVEIRNIEKTKVVTMDSLDREQKKAIVTSNLSVKSSTNFLTRTVDRIKKGDSVIIISSDKGYTKIRTEKGKIGYIKSKKVANEITVREEMKEEKQIEGKVNLVWDYYSNVGSAPDRSGTSIDGVNVVAPAFFYLDDDGNLKDNIGEKGENYIDWAHDNGQWCLMQKRD